MRRAMSGKQVIFACFENKKAPGGRVAPSSVKVKGLIEVPMSTK